VFRRVYREPHNHHINPLRNTHIGTRHHECALDSDRKVLWNVRGRRDILFVERKTRKFPQTDIPANLSGLQEERDHPQAQLGLCIYKKLLRLCNPRKQRRRKDLQLRQEPRGGLKRAINWPRKFKERMHGIVEYIRALLARRTLVRYS